MTDHGRGNGDATWSDHGGDEIPESKYIWMGFLGPDTAALGERSKIGPVTQNQVAATLAGLLGEDYAREVHQAGPPVIEALPAEK